MTSAIHHLIAYFAHHFPLQEYNFCGLFAKDLFAMKVEEEEEKVLILAAAAAPKDQG